MIKLIATDMDGTLLNSYGELPKDFFETLNALINQGVFFVAASGRQYHTLSNNFGIAKDKIIYAAENGSYIAHKGKELFSKTLDREIAIEIIKDAREIEGCYIVLSGKKQAYIEHDNEEFREQVDKYYHRNILVDNLEKVDDEFLKVALYDINGSENNCNKILRPKYGERLHLAVSGEFWLDLGRDDVNKGVAIKFLQERLGIGHDETMVFGDYFNDIHMLQSAFHSYVMTNAPEGVKKYGRFIAGSNDDNAVMKIIKRNVLKKEA